jgi:hypothetical protein
MRAVCHCAWRAVRPRRMRAAREMTIFILRRFRAHGTPHPRCALSPTAFGSSARDKVKYSLEERAQPRCGFR